MRVLAALSGGVDSSVMAALLLDAGHEVVGATMKLWGGASDSGCCSVSDVEDARRSAAQLGIDHHVFNFTEEFDEHVVDPYVAAYAAGRTPNPCVECNRLLKFDVLLRRADMLGFDAVATGHHARVVELDDGTKRIARGADSLKDQSYVLYPVRSAELERVLFPVGEMTKADVRRIAAELGLRTAPKPDSQDVCFITKSDGREAFLAERTELHSARVVDERGVEVGGVDSIEMVTIGQRRGLNLAGGSEPRFVTDVDVATSTVTIGTRADLLSDHVDIEDIVWSAEPVAGRVMVQASAHGQPAEATIEAVLSVEAPAGSEAGSAGADAAGRRSVRLVWAEPHRRIAPGQSVVMYRQSSVDGMIVDYVVGGGIARRQLRAGGSPPGGH